MSDSYILYGSYASYYTAKVRAFLRKKGISFSERLPSDPAFRATVRPSSGSHRIPQLLTPGGEVIQDSVEIVDRLEATHPDVPAFPDSPCQRTFVHLMELYGSAGLLRLAWMHRWVFEENLPFVTSDFGRSFRPQGDDDELRHYGNLIADRMMSYGLPPSTPEVKASLEQAYLKLLALFEAHLVDHPYLLGGHPSAADYAVMGALHAHLGRDPAGLRTMQNHAVRTFRWVEHMMVPEVVSPEFHTRPVAYLEDDQVPQTALDILRFIVDTYGEPFELDGLAFEQAMQRLRPEPGHSLAPDEDQPRLPMERVAFAGEEHEHQADLYAVWLAQRAQRYYHTLPANEQSQVLALFDGWRVTPRFAAPLNFPLERVNNRLVLDRAVSV